MQKPFPQEGAFEMVSLFVMTVVVVAALEGMIDFVVG